MYRPEPKLRPQPSRTRKPRPGSSFSSGLRRLLVLGVLSAAIFVLFLPATAPVAHADSRVWPTGYWGPLLSCTGNYNDVLPVGSEGVRKTCTDVCDLLHTGQNLIDFAITIVVFIGAPAMITLGGIMLIVGGMGGETDQRSKAKNIIVSALIGVAITLGAYLIISTFLWLAGIATTAGENTGDAGISVSWPNVVCNVPPPETPAN